jgi:hypothetical protein
VLLVNPQHIKGLNGYKTDPKDAQWIADLLEGGKLRGSWVPPRAIRELRDLTRQRVHVLEDLNRAKSRIEQLCKTGNIKVSSVATDLFGVSGRKMLAAIVEGKHDAGWMADYAKGTLRGKRRELTLALEGSFTDEQRWLLKRELQQVEWLEQQVATLEQEIERRVAGYDPASADHSGSGPEDGLDDRGRNRGGHAGVCGCAPSRKLGGIVSRKPGEWRQALQRTGAPGQPVRQTGAVPGGVGGFAYQGHLFGGFLSADVRAQGCTEGRDGPGASHHRDCVSGAEPR